MTKPENKNVVEVHGCIVCAKTFNILAVYSLDGRLVDCSVTSAGGHIVKDEQQPLVTCDTHTEEGITTAYIRWQSRHGKESGDEQEDE